jgi:hypothetical protein
MDRSPTTNAGAAACRSTTHGPATSGRRRRRRSPDATTASNSSRRLTQTAGRFRSGGRRSRGDPGDEAPHPMPPGHVASDAHPNPLCVGLRRSRPSCQRVSRLRSVRPRSALRARRRGREFAVRAPALPRSAAQPRCHPLARTARTRATPCQCRSIASCLRRACTYCSERVFDSPTYRRRSAPLAQP